jgi:hypothetical protein
MESLFSWEVTSVLATFAAGLGFYFVSEREFKIGKALFLLAAADSVGGIVMWGAKIQQSLASACAAVFVMAGTVAVLALLAIKFADRKSENPLPEPPTPMAPRPPVDAYKHSPPPPQLPRQDHKNPAQPAPEGEKKPAPPPADEHAPIVVALIQSLMVDAKLTFVPKDGAKLHQGNEAFLFLSDDTSKIQGDTGEFLLSLEGNRNLRIQEDNKVVVTYRYTLPPSSDLLGKPLNYLDLVDKMSLVLPTSMDTGWAKTVVYAEVGVYVNGNLWGLLPAAVNREVTQKATIASFRLTQFKRF